MSGFRSALIALPLALLAAGSGARAQGLMVPPSTFRIQPAPLQPGETQTADPSAGTLAPSVACPGKLQAAQEKNDALQKSNNSLRGEVLSLQEQLSAFTSRGGSRVTAYCESPTLSRNTAGATNDCAAAGYGCEPVSGLCRTSAQSSDHCSGGFAFDDGSNTCKRHGTTF